MNIYGIEKSIKIEVTTQFWHLPHIIKIYIYIEY